MLLKLGVSIERLRPEIRKHLTAIDSLYIRITGDEAVITSTYEGSHSPGSIHYSNLAIDIRRPAEGFQVLKPLQELLGVDFDIVIEPDHIHIEYDPN